MMPMLHMLIRTANLWALLLPWHAFAQALPYTLDPVHTRVMFAVDHAGFSKAIGTVSGSTGELWFDPDDWTTARLRATVPLGRIDLGDAKWNKAALGGRLLDADKYPTATFVSSGVEAVDPQHAKVRGNLTLHGVTREVVLDVVFNAAKRHPMPPFRRTAGFSATTALRRKEFGITAWSGMIGDRVELRIEAEAVRVRASQAGDGEPGETESATTPEQTPRTEAGDAGETDHDRGSATVHPEPDPAQEVPHGTDEPVTSKPPQP